MFLRSVFILTLASALAGAGTDAWAQQPSSKDAERVAQVPIPAPHPEQGHPGRDLKIAGIATGAVGLAACWASIVFGLRAKSKDSESARSAVYDPQLKKDADSARTTAYVFFTVGGAAVVTGTILAILGWTSHGSADASARSSPVASAQPMLGPKLAGLVLGGVF